MRRILLLLSTSVILTVVAGTAWAYWGVSSVPGGNGAAAAATVNQGPTPTASASGSTVTVSWAASTLTSGQPVSGYLVKRYDAGTLAVQSIQTACTGTVTTTSCVESNVPYGAWKYSVTPVVATSWLGAESAKSATLNVADVAAPTNAVTMSPVTGGSYMTGTTVYYRGAAAGSLKLTNAVADAASGPASSATAALTGVSTGWTHTPSLVNSPAGGPFVSNPFSWTAGTTSAPSVAVTGRDAAGNPTVTTVGFVNDSTAPTAGSITYADGYAAGRSVSVSFTSGTDAGSGVATRRLQRAVATLSGSSCGTFGGFADIGGATPTSPYTDGSLGVGCYKYRYVVTDRVGNSHVATSANVVKVGYAGAIGATSGLLSLWHLGEAATSLTAADAFVGTSGSALAGRSVDTGTGTWGNDGGSASVVVDNGRLRRNAAGYSIDYVSTTPSSADYSVSADLVVRSNLANDGVGIAGRMNTGANTFYLARWQQSNTSWNLLRYANGTVTSLASLTGQPALTVDEAYRLRLEMVGSSIKLYVNGVQTLTATDGTYSAAGRAGFMTGLSGTSPAQTGTTGLHLDNFQVTPASYPRAADAKGTNTGDYTNGVTLGVPGAIGGGDTAASFDGVNDHVQMTQTTGFPVGASVRSTELWFKTSGTGRQVLFRYGSAGTAKEYGLWIDAGGSSMTAWGWGGGNDKTFNLAAAVNDGAWHHVVETFDGSAITLYVDGSALPSQTVTRATAMDAYGFGIGAVIRPSDSNSGGFFSGSIDEVSFYTSVLTATQVTDHYQLGLAPDVDATGPAGGSVDATGLAGTGSRYATSTTLNLSLGTGTDASGVATSGNEVLRATAALTNGSCGSFGSFASVATDPGTPFGDTVTDQACYRYQYVVADVLGNTTTYTSPDVKVDATAPAAPQLTFSATSNTYWPGSGSTVYYRSAAGSGSFTATATTTDTASGIASYGFPTLGSGWTSTPGATGVNTYAWSSAPAAPGTKNVTAVNNAGLTSANAPFTLTADDSAPTAGTVTYLDGSLAVTTVPVTFTTGLDSGSGIGTRLLQRASATLTGSSCGSFGSFATVTGGTNPSSPFTDTTVSRGTCYQYRYVVTDNVGNQHVATSANVVKVLPTYSDLVSGTAGLLNLFRLGEATTSYDSMAGTAGATLQSRAGETGASWSRHPAADADAVLTSAGRVRKNGTTWGALYSTTTAPASADYTVEADVYVASNLASDAAGVAGRLDPANTNGTGYLFRYEQSGQAWFLYKIVNGGLTVLGQSGTQALAPGSTYKIALSISGTSLRGYVNGVAVASATDAGITAPGRGGLVMGFDFSFQTTTVTNTTGMHLDNFRVNPGVADSAGTNDGTYVNGPALGQTGALTDTDTAVRFDGVDDFATMPRQIQDDFSVEFWFKSTQGIGTGSAWTQGAGMVDANTAGSSNDFGVSLRSDGRVVAGIGGTGGDVSVTSSAGYDNGAWHHVVLTRTRATGAFVLYVDGAVAASGVGSTASLATTANLNLGRIQSGTGYFQGTLDEVATYNVALTPATVLAHYLAATS